MAWFTFTDASREVFVLELTEPGLVGHARALLAGEDSDPRIGGTVVKSPVAHNIGWSYHIDPASVFFFEMSTEVGDSTMRYIEDHLDEVGGELLPGSVWTGWSSTLTGELQAKQGGAGADRLRGGKDADLLFGKAGNDRLFGRRGDDHLACGAGDDWSYGGRGNDKLGGEAGDDRLSGGQGHDLLVGGAGSDKLSGRAGNDRLSGDAGADRLAGGQGRDTFVLQPGGGADRIVDFADDTMADDWIDLTAFDLHSLSGLEIVADGQDALLRLDGASLRLEGYLYRHDLGDFGRDDVLL